nr:hypothetical protein Iba_chr13eCG13020 [Ipomoea batatas]
MLKTKKYPNCVGSALSSAHHILLILTIPHLYTAIHHTLLLLLPVLLLRTRPLLHHHTKKPCRQKQGGQVPQICVRSLFETSSQK